MKPIRVAHLIWSLECGGSQRSLLVLVRNTSPERIRHGIVSFTDRMAAAPEMAAAGCKVCTLHKRAGCDMPALFRLRSAAARFRPDVLHLHDFTACFWARVAGLPPGPDRAAASVHTSMRRLNPVKRALYLQSLRRMGRTLVLSDSARQRLTGAGVPAERIRVAPLGPDPGALRLPPRPLARAGLKVEPERVVCLTCARLEPEKGIAGWIRLAVRAHRLDPRLLFIIAGTGSLQPRLERLLAALGSPSCIRLLGFRRDIPALLAAADLYAQPSLDEELPLSVLEALRAGLPVIATPVGSLPDLLTGEPPPGFLVPAGDGDAWTACLLRLVSEPGLRARLGAAAAALVRARFHAPTAVQEMERMYQTLAASGKRRP